MAEFQSSFLLVDDDDPTNVFHKYVLEKAILNSKVHTVMSGHNALDWLNDLQNEPPNVIFLDINMPIMSGWEFLHQLQQFSKERLPDRIVIFQSHPPNTEQVGIINNLKSEITFHQKPLTLEWISNNIKATDESST